MAANTLARNTLATLMIVALIAIVGITKVPSASAAVVFTSFRAANTTNPPLCLDGYSTRGERSDLYVTGCNSGPFQTWRWDTVDETWLDSQASGQGCVQWTGGRVEIVACRLIPAQYWVRKPPFIKWWANQDYCLARFGGQGADVLVERCDGAVNQIWEVV